MALIGATTATKEVTGKMQMPLAISYVVVVVGDATSSALALFKL